MTATMAMVNNTNTVNVIDESLVSAWLKFADVAPKSVKTYNKAIRRFFVYLNDHNITAPTADDVYNWRDSLKAENKAASTVNLYLSSCKLFFKFLNDLFIIKNNFLKIIINYKTIF